MEGVTENDGVYVVNIHTDKECEEWSLTHSLPNEPRVTFTAKRDCDAGFRLYDFMKNPRLLLGGKEIEGEACDGVLIARGISAGDALELVFDMETVEKKEFFAGREYTEFWRGGDMIDVLPHGDHIRLYQRDNSVPKYYPLPEDVEFTGASDRGPTQQSPDK